VEEGKGTTKRGGRKAKTEEKEGESQKECTLVKRKRDIDEVWHKFKKCATRGLARIVNSLSG